MYEHKSKPLASRAVFYRRILRSLSFASVILSACLLIGCFGFHYLADASWIDAFHNSSMLLSGMGPVIPINDNGGKIFSSLYALFSGVVFITNIGVILAPLVHRIFHRLHLEDNATS